MTSWTPDQDPIDAVAELVTIGVGRAAATLSELIGQRIDFSLRGIRACQTEDSRREVLQSFQQVEIVVSQTFAGPIRGRMSLGFPANSSLALASLIPGNCRGVTTELDAELRGVLIEVGTILSNGIMGSLSHALPAALHYSLPELRTAHSQPDQVLRHATADEDLLIGEVHFSLSQQEVHGSIVILLAVGSLQAMIDALLSETPQ